MKKWVITGVAVVALLGGIGFAWSNRPRAAPAATGPQQATTVEVTKTDLMNTAQFQGSLGYGPATTLTGRKPGTVTWLPAAGAVIEPGQPLYKVDDRPVLLFAGETPLFRKLETPGTRGPDAEVVNANLGLNGDEYGSVTAAALKRWQKTNKLPETGHIEPGDVVVLPGKVRVESAKISLGGKAEGELMSLTGADRAVTVDVPADQTDALKQGTEVSVELPDGKQAKGTVTSVGTSASSAEGNKNDKPKVVATVALADAGGLMSGPVKVKVASETKTGVLAVPVGALVALKEGGYALQREEGGFLAVTTGLFSNGMVEVTGDGLTEGMEVVTTS
ncbi:efflux RND transporter periplasmic adaptor subunit [Lentzea tibetensis]|uniref:Efflux RND transporter periplasmic adaptor subunit n=1 Tax=Lentzea tibetensis TaxID=2591470 RepID=A0A563EGN5_9PSEU|nr:efflux RND transporter periplasmic adaptor subunit [Lentzea tibetensis]TWP45222.1 efflux RND transporter periplasmic adaptor subunit [Lentzea tibetensis]